MPCCGQTKRSALPVVTQVRAIAVASNVEAAKPEKPKVARKKKKRPILDFHCATCGLVKENYPNYRHKCPGPQPVAYQIARQAICDTCPHNRDGVCRPLQIKQPNAPCLVTIGVAMAGAECPLTKWRRVLFRCDKCGSARFDDRGLLACPVCRQMPTAKLRDA
jgi:hypothetical protein